MGGMDLGGVGISDGGCGHVRVVNRHGNSCRQHSTCAFSLWHFIAWCFHHWPDQPEPIRVKIMDRYDETSRQVDAVQERILEAHHGTRNKVIDHINKINAFIPEAWLHARNQPPGNARDLAFHTKMNELKKAAGLI